ncbi:C13 family peptidase [Tabrizicola sp.]|uniref:C13 family peptidase n=1 Tax=Tabrizicola sp. TaxID=2005166 RepID=UPI003F3A8BF1
MTTEATTESRISARPALVALAAVLLYWVADILAQMGHYGPGGEIGVWGIQSALAQSAVITVGLFLGLVVVRRVDLVFRSITLVFLLGTCLNLLVWSWISRGGSFASPEGWRALQNLLLLPQLALLVWLLRAPLRRWVVSGVAMAVVFLGTQELVARHFPVEGLYYLPDDVADGDYQPVDVEALYAAQDRLMTRQLSGIAPGTPGTPEVFGLFLGGTSNQSVFLTEVESVSGILDDLYGSGSRSIRLANSNRHPNRYPLANRANLDRALAEIGKLQGPEDVAFLFLTSHGKEDTFSLDFYEAGTTDLTAAEFAAMLERSGIGPAVIVVSACHSGSFVDDIEAPDRLIITAARADRTSFGCRDGAEWTEFGQSFFDLALRAEPDPRKAFAVAAADVERKEKADDLKQSLPQMSEGAEIGAVLDRLLALRSASGG